MKKLLRKMLRYLHVLFGNKGLWKLPFVPAIYESIYWLSSSDKLVTVDYRGMKVTVFERDSGTARVLILTKEYESYEIDLFLQKVNQGNIIFDIGANIGVFSIVACKELSSTGCVYAFEPAPFNFKLLETNIKQNKFSNCKLESLLVSEIDGNQKFFLDKHQFANHSLISSNIGSLDTAINVNSIKLDTYCEKNKISFIDILKMDVQGAEPQVLEGADTLLKSGKIGKLFVEYWVDGLKEGTDLVEIIRGYGYKVYYIDEVKQKITLANKNNIKNSGCYNLYCEL